MVGDRGNEAGRRCRVAQRLAQHTNSHAYHPHRSRRFRARRHRAVRLWTPGDPGASPGSGAEQRLWAAGPWPVLTPQAGVVRVQPEAIKAPLGRGGHGMSSRILIVATGRQLPELCPYVDDTFPRRVGLLLQCLSSAVSPAGAVASGSITYSSREARQQKRGEGGVEVQGKQAQERPPMVSLVHFPIRAMLVMYGSGSGPPSRRPAIPRDASRTRLTPPVLHRNPRRGRPLQGSLLAHQLGEGAPGWRQRPNAHGSGALSQHLRSRSASRCSRRARVA